jgi:hypothetical protein
MLERHRPRLNRARALSRAEVEQLLPAYRSSHCLCRWWFLTKSPALRYDDATDSMGCFMSTDMRHELYG